MRIIETVLVDGQTAGNKSEGSWIEPFDFVAIDCETNTGERIGLHSPDIGHMKSTDNFIFT